MGRLSSFLLVVLCVGVGTVQGTDPWFPDPWAWGSSPPPAETPPPLYPTPQTPSPYYDAPPYGGEPPMASSPPWTGSPPPPTSSPWSWWSCSIWAQKTDSWPAPYTADTLVGDAFGPDAVKVYGQLSMYDGILAKGDDGYSDLLKQGITSLLNSADKGFKYSASDIKKSFSLQTSLSSEASASMQAKEFEAANEAYSGP